MAKAQANFPAIGDKAHWWQADIIDQLGKFHGIFGMTTFEFISRPEWALSKLYACLEQGGCLLIGVIKPLRIAFRGTNGKHRGWVM